MFIDARSPEAWGKSDFQIPGSIRVPPDDVGTLIAAIPHPLIGGFNEWVYKGYPTEPKQTAVQAT